MSDLNYNINASVTGADDVDALREDIEDITEDVGTLNETSATVAVTTTGVDTAKTELGEVGTKGEEIGTKAEGGASVLGEAMGAIIEGVSGAQGPMDAAGDTAATLGEDLEGAGGKAGILATVMSGIGAAISIGAAVWTAFSERQREATRTTEEVSEALNENVGALGQMKAVLDDLIDSGNFTGLDALNQALLDQDPEAFTRAAENLGVLGGSFRDVSETLTNLQTDELATLNDLIAQSGIPPELADSARELVLAGGELVVTNDRLSGSTNQLGRDVNLLRNEYGEQIDALVGLRAAQDTLDIESVAQQYLDSQRAVEGYAEMLERAREAAGPDASIVDVFNEFVPLQAQATQDAAAFAEQQEAAAQGALDLASAMQSVDFQAAELQGATTAMSEFNDMLFAGSNQIQAQEDAYARLQAAADETGLTFDLTTEAGRAQNDALEAVADVVGTRLAEAYDLANGNQEAFMESARQIGEETLADLADRLDLTTEEVDLLRGALGLTEGDYQARFEMSGVAEAQLQLGLLQGAITGLPDTVEAQVNLLILQGDYVGARDAIVTYYADNPVVLPTDADTTGADTAIASVVDADHPTTITADADTSAADDDIASVTDADHPTTITADADTIQAASDLLDTALEPRTATIVAHAHTAGAEIDLAALADKPRTANIDVNALAGGFEREMAFLLRPRTVNVTLRYNSRIEGSRPGP